MKDYNGLSDNKNKISVDQRERVLLANLFIHFVKE